MATLDDPSGRAPRRRMAVSARSAASDGVERTRRAWRLDPPYVLPCALALVVGATILGGASQDNALPQTAVELASLPLLFTAVRRLLAEGAPKQAVLPLILLVAIVAVPLLQLVPLPAAVWTRLPGRGAVAEAMDAAGLGRPALPFSLTPEETWRSLLALIPPAAMFLGTLAMSVRQKRMLVLLWIGLGFLSLLVGALQLVGGPDSPLYVYQITNLGSPVGLFANRNHHAAFIVALVPFAALLAAELRRGLSERQAVAPAIAALFIPVATVGVGVIQSRAGIAVLSVALLSAVALALKAGTIDRRTGRAAGVAMVGLAGLAVVGLFALGPILGRFDALTDRQELRFYAWPLVAQLAWAHLPLGVGIGAFELVYRAAEPLNQVSEFYLNHAHNDFLELWLETGVAGLLLFLAFAAWLVREAWRAWASPRPIGPADALAAAASLTVFLLLLHSVVDYPLRTQAVVVLFAFACGTLASPRSTK